LDLSPAPGTLEGRDMNQKNRKKIARRFKKENGLGNYKQQKSIFFDM